MAELPPIATTDGDTGDDDSNPTTKDPGQYGLVLLWSAEEPHRVGQIAFLRPFIEILLGRGDHSGRPFAQFAFQQPGQPHVVTPGQEFLAGAKISRLHLVFIASALGVEMRKLGPRATYVNGKLCGDVTVLQEGDVIFIAKQALFLGASSDPGAVDHAA